MKRLISAIVIVLFFLLLGYALLIYATGKRLTSDGKLVGVGIVQVDTTPDDSKISINGEFKKNGDTNIENLEPGKYTLLVEKDHYHPWQKEIEVQEGKITPLKVTLFPLNPSLTAATFDGVSKPVVSPDGQKIAFGVVAKGKEGIYILNLAERQFFFSPESLRQIADDSSTYTFSTSTFSWSRDSQSVLAEVKNNQTGIVEPILLDQSTINSNPQKSSQTAEALKQTWAKQIADDKANKLEDLGVEAQNLAKDAKELIFSKDNSAVIIVKADDSAIVYDTKPSPVPGVKPLTSELPVGKYQWFQNGTKHILALENNVISLLDTDGTNKTSIFTGDFDQNGVFTYPDGSRVVMTINLNARSNPLPNLYTIDLR